MTKALPPGWASAPLSSIGTWLGGGTPSKSVREYWASGTVPWVSPKDMKRLLIDSAQDQITEKAVKESATNLIPASSVLMVTRSGILEHTFPVAVNTVPVTINQDLKAWTPAHGIDPLYVAYFLRSHAQAILDTCSKDGTTVSSIDFDRLSRFKVSLAPSQAQTRIVSKIDELFSEIGEGERALGRVQKLVERYRQSVLKAAVTGELTAESRNRKRDRLESGDTLLKRILLARRQAWERKELDKFKAKGLKTVSDRWKTKYPEPCAPDDAMLPELPAGWIWASIDQVSLNHDGARIPVKASDRDKRSGPYPYYGAQGVIDNIDEFLFDGDFLLVAEDGENLRSRIKPLAFPASGQFWVNNHAHVLSSFPGVELSFLEIAINSLDISRSVTGTAQPKLTQAALSRLPIPVPPIDEQLEITSLVNAVLVHCRIALQSANQESRRANALRQSILKEAFSGGLVSKCNDDPVVRRPDEVAERHSVSARGAKKVRAT